MKYPKTTPLLTTHPSYIITARKKHIKKTLYLVKEIPSQLPFPHPLVPIKWLTKPNKTNKEAKRVK